MKIKAKIYKGKRIVMGDKNLVTKNEIHVNDIPGNDKHVNDGMEYYKINTKILENLNVDINAVLSGFILTSIVDGKLFCNVTYNQDVEFNYMCGNAKFILYGNVTGKNYVNTQLEEYGTSLNDTSIFKPITAKEYYSLLKD